MYKKLITIILFGVCINVYSQIGIGTVSPHSSSILDIESSNKGFLLPRVSSDADINAPTEGLIIYDLSDNCLNVYNNNSWIDLCNTGTAPTSNGSSQPTVSGLPRYLDYVKAPQTDITAGAQFGTSVSLTSDGGIMAVGQMFLGTGEVYIYKKMGVDYWAYVETLVSPDASINNYFGSAVELSQNGTTLVVGANRSSVFGTNKGAVYIYKLNNTGNFVYTATVGSELIVGANTNAIHVIGNDVEVSADGSTVVVAAVTSSTSNQGMFSVYDETNTIPWSVTYSQTTGTPISVGRGTSVSLSGDGNTIAVTNSYYSTSLGTIFIYEKAGGVWSNTHNISNPSSLYFGFSNSLNFDGTVLATASSDVDFDGVNGETYVFRRVAGGMFPANEEYLFTGSHAPYAPSDFAVGQSDIDISNSGDEILISSAYDASGSVTSFSDASKSGSGAAYLIKRDGGVWSQELYIKSPYNETAEGFSNDLSISADGSTMAIGVQSEDSSDENDPNNNSAADAGAVYIFQ